MTRFLAWSLFCYIVGICWGRRSVYLGGKFYDIFGGVDWGACEVCSNRKAQEAKEPASWSRFLARQKFRFDIGSGMTSQGLSLFNSAMLLSIVARKYLGLRASFYVVVGAAAAYIIGTWALGWILAASGFQEAMASEGNKYNAAMRHIERMVG